MLKYLTVVFFLLLFFAACLPESSEEELVFKNHCGSCHLPPDPASLPKSIWEGQVLPEMGARMGLRPPGYEYKKKEVLLPETSAFYPMVPTISREDWSKIVHYVLRHAPDTLTTDLSRRYRNRPLTLFSPEPLQIDGKPGSYVTSINYDKNKQRFVIGQVDGELSALDSAGNTPLAKLSSSIMWWSEADGKDYLTEVGYMPPTEKLLGSLTAIENGRAKTLHEGLHRPVHTLVRDLNGDGTPEFVISEFGYFTGRLNLFKKGEGEVWEESILSTLPGFICTAAADMNGDGREDLIGVVSQGDEGVFIFFQKENLAFEAQRVIRLSPVFGTSWMEVVDFDGDGDLDIVLAQGDNADFSMVNKAFHGVRIFINEGKHEFRERFFYPLYGATRVLARDFDEDGDIDLAVIAFFPDYEHLPEESFVFLENKDPAAFQFQAYTFPEAATGNWMVAEAGDFDGDGDLDILLGSFTLYVAPIPKAIKKSMLEKGPDLLLLRNRLRD